jgi:magnesium-transporting ATPase (P-type)
MQTAFISFERRSRNRGTNKTMFRDKMLIVFFGSSLFVLIAAALLVLFGLPSGNNNLILHFNAGEGVDMFGSRSQVLEILVVAFAIGVINALLAREIYYRERFLSYLIAFATLIISVFILVAAGVVVSVN